VGVKRLIVEDLRGDPGDPGAKGKTGATGATGNIGATGKTGEQGEMGPPGKAGPPGERGASGTQGQAGPDGSRGNIISRSLWWLMLAIVGLHMWAYSTQKTILDVFSTYSAVPEQLDIWGRAQREAAWHRKF